MSVDNTKIAAVWPGVETYDTFICAQLTTGSLNNAAGSYSVSVDTGQTNQGLPIGIYSLDKGITWYDANGYDGPILLKWEANTNGSAQMSWTGGASGLGSIVSFILKAGFLSINQSETLNSPIGGSPVLSYNTGVNYQKILTTTEVSTGTGVVAVNHNLNKIPTFRLWLRAASGRIGAFSSIAVPGDGNYADTSNINLITNNGIPSTGTAFPGQNWITRIYKD